MTMKAVVRISRISFQTDMTRADAPVIPFARILESVWPDQARWMGLIGRTRLTPLELDKINLLTWPEFREPHKLLQRVWDCGWEAPWGEAGNTTQANWIRSALAVDSEDLGALLPESIHDDPDATLTEATPLLLARLIAERNHLAPLFLAPVTPIRLQPTAARTETDVVPLAA